MTGTIAGVFQNTTIVRHDFNLFEPFEQGAGGKSGRILVLSNAEAAVRARPQVRACIACEIFSQQKQRLQFHCMRGSQIAGCWGSNEMVSLPSEVDWL